MIKSTVCGVALRERMDEMLKSSPSFFKIVLMHDKIELEKDIERLTGLKIIKTNSLEGLFEYCVGLDIINGTENQREFNLLKVIQNE